MTCFSPMKGFPFCCSCSSTLHSTCYFLFFIFSLFSVEPLFAVQLFASSSPHIPRKLHYVLLHNYNILVQLQLHSFHIHGLQNIEHISFFLSTFYQHVHDS
ncbi:hypothetical protein ILYODFUR_038118 [Ilyodon furcidens]|uniref:Secreted protein n=1 Tax=Ilyodon furcidens TaxID=33524 RepID=A0ABV0TT77_9TELE